jgi:rRNA maturation protein Nop10
MSLNDGQCSACDYDEDDYSNCPKCNNTTLDENGVCQADDCNFRYETCLKCQENRYNTDDGECEDCGYSKDSHEFCPLCEEQTLDGGECVNSDCNYNASNYEECPDCEEYTVEDGTCFKCGRDLEEDEEELEVEDDD